MRGRRARPCRSASARSGRRLKRRFRRLVGIIEIVVGLAIPTVLPTLGAYIASVWLLLIAGNLVLGAYFDIAVRDAVLSISAFGLARLLEAMGYQSRVTAPGGWSARRVSS